MYTGLKYNLSGQSIRNDICKAIRNAPIILMVYPRTLNCWNCWHGTERATTIKSVLKCLGFYFLGGIGLFGTAKSRLIATFRLLAAVLHQFYPNRPSNSEGFSLSSSLRGKQKQLYRWVSVNPKVPYPPPTFPSLCIDAENWQLHIHMLITALKPPEWFFSPQT